MAHKNIALFVTHAGCPHRCIFCDQSKISGHSGRLFAQDVINACELALGSARPDDVFELGFFGGSFTAISREYMDELLTAAYPYIKSGALSGIRISTRPDCIDDEILEHLRSFGVTAIELGAQSMDDNVLKIAQRGHDSLCVERASRLIKQYGFSLGLQMMTGLPGDTPEISMETARRIAALEPDTVRVYPAIVIKNTHLADMYYNGSYVPQTLDEAVELCCTLIEFFEKERNIPIIKLGLQHEQSLDKGYAAGPYHPAFRELCESAGYLKIMRSMLTSDMKNKKLTFFVPPRELSKVIGQKRSNIAALFADGFSAVVKPDESTDCIRLKVGEDI